MSEFNYFLLQGCSYCSLYETKLPSKWIKYVDHHGGPLGNSSLGGADSQTTLKWKLQSDFLSCRWSFKITTKILFDAEMFKEIALLVCLIVFSSCDQHRRLVELRYKRMHCGRSLTYTLLRAITHKKRTPKHTHTNPLPAKYNLVTIIFLSFTLPKLCQIIRTERQNKTNLNPSLDGTYGHVNQKIILTCNTYRRPISKRRSLWAQEKML